MAVGAPGHVDAPVERRDSSTIAASRSAPGGSSARAADVEAVDGHAAIVARRHGPRLARPLPCTGRRRRRAAATPPSDRREPERRRGFFRRLRENLSKTREALDAEIQATLFDTLDDETWERLEEALIMADVGARTTAQVVGAARAGGDGGEVEGGEALTARLVELLADIATTAATGAIDLRHEPTVIMVAGVNGTGKTTTIGKLAWHLRQELGAPGRARRRRHVPRRRRRAARRSGRSAPTSRSSPAPRARTPASVAFDAVRQRARARRRRRDHRHRRAPAHAGRAHGRARRRSGA